MFLKLKKKIKYTLDHWEVQVSDLAPDDILNFSDPKIEFAVELFP
jgi:hypothetical protein